MLKRDGTILKIKNSSLAIILIVVFVTFYSGRTWLRNKDWRNEIVFYEAAVRANPQSALMQNDLGIVYNQNNLPQKAIESFKNTLNIRGDDPVTFFVLADSYAMLYRYQKAIVALKQAIALDDEYAEAHYNLAGLYAHAGFNDKAHDHLTKSIRYYRQQGKGAQAKLLETAFKEYFQRSD